MTGQSQVYQDLGAKYVIFVGTAKVFSSVVIDQNTGKAMDFNDAATFATAYVTICNEDGSVIFASNVPAAYLDRNPTTSHIDWTVGPFTNDQAGNWKGYLHLVNNLSVIVDTQVFNFTIQESQ